MARKMKDSGIEWIGEIPEGWEVVPVKRLCTMQAGKNLTSEQIAPEGTYPVYGGNGTRGFFSDYNCDGHFLTVGRQGALCGNVHKVNGKVWATEHAVITTPSSYTSLDFLYYLLIGMDLNQYVSSTAAQPGLAVGTLLNLKTCYPCSTLEQTQISNYLNAKCSEIDVMLSKTHSSIGEYKKLKQAVITQAVTKGVRGKREMKDSGVEWIGEIPKEWDILNLVAHTSMLTPMRDRPENLDGPIPWIRIEDFDGKYISSSKASLGVSKETVRSMNLKIYPVGTILCTSSCIMGKCAIVSRELVSNQRFIGIIPDQNTCENFLYYLMLSNSERMNYLATGALQANLSRSSFEHLKVQFPSYQEQKEISDYLDTKCAEIDKLIAKKEQLVKELESYKKSLIYEVVTGKREV